MEQMNKFLEDNETFLLVDFTVGGYKSSIAILCSGPWLG